MAETIFRQMKKGIYINFPLKGRIVEILNDRAIINIGADVGLKPGDVFEVLDSKEKIIGKIKVINKGVRSKSAECEVIEGNYLSNGLQVRVVEVIGPS